MPLYQTRTATDAVGVFQGQRPSAAACKAFSKLRRLNKDLVEQKIYVLTEGHKMSSAYNVQYIEVTDALGTFKRPVATKIE